jgi:hypothetical protein
LITNTPSPNFVPGPVSGYNFTIVIDATGSRDFTVGGFPASDQRRTLWIYYITPGRRFVFTWWHHGALRVGWNHR